jgi:hypothetical protein
MRLHLARRLTFSTARRLLQKKYQMSPDPDNKGCFLYRAVSGDTIDDMAKALGVSAADLRERNAANIADFSKLNGRFVQVCNINSESCVQMLGWGACDPSALCLLVATWLPPLFGMQAGCSGSRLCPLGCKQGRNLQQSHKTHVVMMLGSLHCSWLHCGCLAPPCGVQSGL